MTISPIPVILNPAAGRGAGRRFLPRLERLAAEMDLPIQVHCTTGAADARSYADALVESGVPLLAAAGGDGTLSEVAGALAGSGTALAVLPLGTGNDLARHLRLPLNPAEAVRGLRSFTISAMDMGLANGRPFLVAAGSGFDAAVALAVNQGVRWLTGSAAYAYALVQTLWRYQPTEMSVEVDGETDDFRGYFAVVANVRGYGGGMQIAPAASVTDGLLDICCVRAVSRLRFLAAAGSVYRGGHINHPAVRMRRGRCIRVQSEPPVPITIDGEVTTDGLVHTTPLQVTVSPGSLLVAIPSGRQSPV